MALIAHRFEFKFSQVDASYKLNLCGSMSSIELQHHEKPKKFRLQIDAPEDEFNQALDHLMKCLIGLQQKVRKSAFTEQELA